MRTEIEVAAQAALDQVDHLIAILDAIHGSTDDEDGGDAEPSLGALRVMRARSPGSEARTPTTNSISRRRVCDSLSAQALW